MNEIQKLVKGRPAEFSERTGCHIDTAKKYSSGKSKPRNWITKLIKWALERGYNAKH